MGTLETVVDNGGPGVKKVERSTALSSMKTQQTLDWSIVHVSQMVVACLN